MSIVIVSFFNCSSRYDAADDKTGILLKTRRVSVNCATRRTISMNYGTMLCTIDKTYLIIIHIVDKKCVGYNYNI